MMNENNDGIVENGEKGGEATVEVSAEKDNAEVIENAPVSESEVSSAYGEGEDTPKESDTVIEIKEGESTKEGVTELTKEKEDTEAPVGKSTEVIEKENEGVEHMTCIREDLAGGRHPETDVPYTTTVVEVGGKRVEVTVPEFDSKYDMELKPEELGLSRQKHETICNNSLKEAVEKDPELAKQFSEKQLDQIKNGLTPEDFTWHHDGGKVGRMQLVDSDIHDATRHTGGIAIWGFKSPYN